METVIPYEVMDCYEHWRNPEERGKLLFAGVKYLYEVLETYHSQCPLLKRILELGNLKYSLEQNPQFKNSPQNIPIETQRRFGSELALLGTLGYSLWHLRKYSGSKGFKFELSELAQINEERSLGTINRIRGQGFSFHCAGILARDGFEIEFIEPGKKKGNTKPDFFALKDGDKYACEVTSKMPENLQTSSNPEYTSISTFWHHIINAVKDKKEKFRQPEYKNGVLLVDCSPIFNLINFSDIPIGATLLHMPDLDQPGPSGEAPVIIYDDSEFCQGLKSFEQEISDVSIRTLMLWKTLFSAQELYFQYPVEYRVIGSIGGRSFWRYFKNALVFPGPEVKVISS